VKVRYEYDMNSDLQNMEFEYHRLQKSLEVEKSIKFQRKALMGTVTLLEWVNKTYNPVDANLNGWSESVMEDIHTYDSIFEELHEKYKTKVKMAPELKLIFAVGGSAVMFHLTNSLFQNALPGANPQMAKGLRRMANNAMMGGMMNNNSGNSGSLGGIGAMLGGMFGGGGAQRMPQGQRRAMPAGPARPGFPPSGASGSGFSSQRSQPSDRNRSSDQGRSMKGPSSNVDDLLNDLINQDPAEINESVAQDIDAILNNERFSEN
jgi:hypothetical protein